MPVSLSSDEVLREEYKKIPQSVDEIVEDPELSGSFFERVNRQLPPEQRFDELKKMNHRLLNLRRRGEENGGLVRKQRNYNGRNKKPK